MIYEYFCNNCNRRFEEITMDRNKQYSPCPVCNKSSNRIISKVNFNAVEMKSLRLFGHGVDGVMRYRS